MYVTGEKEMKAVSKMFPHMLAAQKMGFTLAEVLIVIGIVGIIAVFVIPNIFAKIENAKNLIVLKRAYTDLQLYLKDFDREYDCNGDLDSCTAEGGGFIKSFTEYLVKQQNFSYVNSKNIKEIRPTNLNSDTRWGEYSSNYMVYSSRGYAYAWATILDDKSSNPYYSKVISAGRNRENVFLITDIDKLYKGNIRLGRNEFKAFILSKEQIYPDGSKVACPAYFCRNWEITKTCNPKETPTEQPSRLGGWGCLQRIIDEGWKITY
jgi:prepilin-type N-terminal cleavage/methylation domain-containing protein